MIQTLSKHSYPLKAIFRMALYLKTNLVIFEIESPQYKNIKKN